MKAIDYLNSLMAGQEMGSSIPIQLTELKALKSFLEADQQCAAHAREVALSEAMRRVRGATGGVIQPNDWWVGFKTARAQFTNAIEQLKAGK